MVIGGDAAGMSAASPGEAGAIPTWRSWPSSGATGPATPPAGSRTSWGARSTASTTWWPRRPSSCATTSASTCGCATRRPPSTATASEVEVRDLDHDRTVRIGFDQLLIATGASPRRPDIPGINGDSVLGVQTLGDGERDCWPGPGSRRARRSWSSAAATSASRWPRRSSSGGPRSPWSTRPREADAHARSRDGRARAGGDGAARHRGPLRRGQVDGFEPGQRPPRRRSAGCRPGRPRDGRRTQQRAGRAGRHRPRHPGRDLGQRPPAAPTSTASGRRATAPRPSTGCRSGRSTSHWARWPTRRAGLAGINLGGGYATFPGVVGTAITKLCATEIARTGLAEHECDRAGIRFESGRRGEQHDRRVLAGGVDDDGQDARRAGQRPAAGYADRRR